MFKLNSSPIRVSSLQQEGELKVSRWLKHQVLLNDGEMSDLLLHLGPLSACIVSEPVSAHEMVMDGQYFLDKYREYSSLLQEGKIPDSRSFRKYFSMIWTKSTDVLYAMPVTGDRYLVKAIRPVIQLQMHHFYYSRVDRKYHSMVLGPNSISWGIQFSYPQLYQDPRDHSYAKVVDSDMFPNTRSFLALAKWMRANTVPACFVIDDQKTFVPMRLGKKCTKWIHRHPQLIANNIKIDIKNERRDDAD